MILDDEYKDVQEESTEEKATDEAYVYVDEPAHYEHAAHAPEPEQKKRSIFPTILITALITAIICLCGAYLIMRDINFTSAQQAAQLATPTPQNTQAQSEEPTPNSTASQGLVIGNNSGEAPDNVIQECMKTVVSINIEVVTSTFYGDTVSTGSGSGVIMTADGYIATCNHVIKDADSVSVKLQDGTTYEAKIVGYDSRTDLAIIKIEAENLPAAAIGDSNAYPVGSKVYAIGNPLGEYASTVTNGIISGIDRSVEIDGTSMTLMQTDAAINPGNSGGGLFSAETGELLGIVNAKNYGTEIEGLGFAIPTSAAHDVIIDLMDKGFVTGRPYLGIATENVNFSSGGGFFFGTVTTYVRAKSVADDSPAQRAGIQAGDYILRVGDTDINTTDDLQNALDNYNAGDIVALTVSRNNQTLTINVTLGERSGK